MKHIFGRTHPAAFMLLWATALPTLAQDAMPEVGAVQATPPAVRVPEVFGNAGGFAFPVSAPVTAGSPLDLSYLNDPAADRTIIVADGHYTYADTREPVRFFGINLCAETAMPTRERADAIATRLAQLGVNIVRLHHIDNMWARETGGSLWPADGAMDRLDPDALDRLGYLVAALKAKGIYCNLNLKVSKHLGPEHGVPEGSAFVHQKRVDRFFPALIEHQKWYAKTILSWKNPHTGLTFAQDPAVALVEINNENSIMHLWPGKPLGEGWEELGEPYRVELLNQWRAWLTDKYGNDAALRKAWLGSLPPDEGKAGQPVPVSGPWVSNGLAGTQVDLRTRDGQHTFELSDTTETDWHAQALWLGVPLAEGRTYVLKLTLSADAARDVRISVDRAADGTYRNVGLDRVVNLSTKPQTHELHFTTRAVDTVHRVALNLGSGGDGRITVHASELVHGPRARDTMGSLAAGGFTLDGPRTEGQQRDWLTFLTDIERRFSDDMRRYLRDELDVDKPLADSQVQWGGSSAYEREGLARPGGSNFVDTHAYWNHPTFASGKDWDPSSWTFGNESIIEALDRGQKALINLATYRVAGHPFGVSELDQASPSDWAVELLPVISTFAAAQDWDAVYLFSGDDPGPDPDQGIRGYFEQLAHTAKAGQYPAAALVFRRGLIPPAPARTLTAPTPLWPQAPQPADAWNQALGSPLTVAQLLGHRHAIALQPHVGVDTAPHVTTGAGPSPLAFRTGPAPLYTAASEHAVSAVGFLGDAPITLGDVTLTPPTTGLTFGSITLVPLDHQPLATSQRMLLTVIGRAQNQAMGWNKHRTSVGTHWGHGPMQIQLPEAALQLPGGRFHAWALSNAGQRTHRAAVDQQTLTVRVSDATIYYEIVRGN